MKKWRKIGKKGRARRYSGALGDLSRVYVFTRENVRQLKTEVPSQSTGAIHAIGCTQASLAYSLLEQVFDPVNLPCHFY